MIHVDFNSINSIKDAEFGGFIPFDELLKQLPASNGVYMILRTGKEAPEFLVTGTGGHFKDKDPNVSIDVLNDNWIENTKVIYIGKATNLKKRLSQYQKFGEGRNIGHYGGRYIWQIKNAMDNLIVCWKATIGEDEDKIETELIQSFRDQYGKRPFANLKK